MLYLVRENDNPIILHYHALLRG